MKTSERSPAAARPRRKPTALRREEIVDAALRIIASRGGRDFTARALADAIGISDAAVFRHFASKDAIVDAVVARMEAVLFEGFPPADADPIARLGTFFRHRTRTLLEHRDLSRLLLTDHLAHVAGPAAARRIAAFRRRTQEFVVSCLREAAKQSRPGGAVSPEAGVVLVTGAIQALGHRSVRHESDEVAERLSKEVWAALEALLRGAGRKPRPRESR